MDTEAARTMIASKKNLYRLVHGIFMGLDVGRTSGESVYRKLNARFRPLAAALTALIAVAVPRLIVIDLPASIAAAVTAEMVVPVIAQGARPAQQAQRAQQSPAPPRPRPVARPAQPATAKPVGGPQFFTATLSVDEMKGKQAVLDTDLGAIVIDLLPEAAPNHVAYFIKTAQDGGYNGTIFHRMIKDAIIQGGDPLTKDPGKADAYGTGGLMRLRAERNGEKNTRGAVSAVLAANNPDSGGSQFFISVTGQPALDGVYDVFGRVVEGILVAQKISEVPVDDKQHPVTRVTVRSVVIRDKPAPVAEAFSTESAGELASYRAVVETSLGNLTLEFLPDKAPNHVRNFLRLAQAGVYDGMAFHRVAKGFVAQTGYLPSRAEPLSESQQRLVHNLQPEFNDTTHVKGTVSMARGDDPASADTSFFISLGPNAVLDGKYTAFARVADGLPVLEALENVPVNGEAPRDRVEVRHVHIDRVK